MIFMDLILQNQTNEKLVCVHKQSQFKLFTKIFFSIMKTPKYLQERLENRCIKTTEKGLYSKELMKIIIIERNKLLVGQL